MGQGNKKEVKVDLPNKGKRNVVGGAGGLGFVGGAGVNAAKGALGLFKSILTRGKKTASALTNTSKQYANLVKGGRVTTKVPTKNTGTIRNAVKNKKNPFTSEEKKGAMDLLNKSK